MLSRLSLFLVGLRLFPPTPAHFALVPVRTRALIVSTPAVLPLICSLLLPVSRAHALHVSTCARFHNHGACMTVSGFYLAYRACKNGGVRSRMVL